MSLDLVSLELGIKFGIKLGVKLGVKLGAKLGVQLIRQRSERTKQASEIHLKPLKIESWRVLGASWERLGTT